MTAYEKFLESQKKLKNLKRDAENIKDLQQADKITYEIEEAKDDIRRFQTLFEEEIER